MSKITNNKRGINPRYFLHENEEWEAKHGANMEPRIVTTMGKVEIPGIKSGMGQGKSIIVDRGRQREDGAYQIHVLPKSVGLYDSFYDAVMSGYSGEAYYMTDEQIEAGTIADSARPGRMSQSGRSNSRYIMMRRESKQHTIKNLMEGFRKYTKGE